MPLGVFYVVCSSKVPYILAVIIAFFGNFSRAVMNNIGGSMPMLAARKGIGDPRNHAMACHVPPGLRPFIIHPPSKIMTIA
jgi:hypothetical protein